MEIYILTCVNEDGWIVGSDVYPTLKEAQKALRSGYVRKCEELGAGLGHKIRGNYSAFCESGDRFRGLQIVKKDISDIINKKR